MDNETAEVEEAESTGDTSEAKTLVNAEDTATSEDAPEVKEAEEKKPRRNRRTEGQRISQLTAKARDLERQLSEARTPPPTPEKSPSRDSYDDYESYIEAKAEFKASQTAAEYINRENNIRAQREQQARDAANVEEFRSVREEVSERGSDEYDDFEAVTQDPDLKISPVMADAILSSEDDGHVLWYHLGKNPKVAEKIYAMNPTRQVLEMGRLSASLADKKTSSAPAPTRRANGNAPSSNALSDKLSTKEWMAKRKEEIRKSNH
jgi:hypothetical protein